MTKRPFGGSPDSEIAFATREEASTRCCDGLLGHGCDHFRVVVLIGDLIIGDDIGGCPLLCMKGLNAECANGNASQQCNCCCRRCFHRRPRLNYGSPALPTFPRYTGKRCRLQSAETLTCES